MKKVSDGAKSRGRRRYKSGIMKLRAEVIRAVNEIPKRFRPGAPHWSSTT